MSALANTFVADLLNHYFANAAHSNIGSGLLGSTSAGSFYCALHVTDPGDSGLQNSGEADYTGYARMPVSRSGGFSVDASTKTVRLAADVSFPKCTGGSGNTVYFWSLGATAGTPHYLILRGGIGLVPRPFTVSSAALAADSIACPNHGLILNDPVALWQYEGVALPAGIAEGRVYFVRSVPDIDTFTLTATLGGTTAVDLQGAGQGTCQKLTPLVIAANVVPKLEMATSIKFQ